MTIEEITPPTIKTNGDYMGSVPAEGKMTP
jgi:hypothetical protein